MTSPAEGSIRKFAQLYTEAWCGQDPKILAAFYSLQGALTINDGSPAVGRAAIAQVALGFMTAFPDMRVSMDALEVEVDRTVYRWTLTGTNAGPGGTGKRIRISGFEQWKIGADGLIAESQGRFDAAEYQRQLECGV
jgi:predicted ester cyclase